MKAAAITQILVMTAISAFAMAEPGPAPDKCIEYFPSFSDIHTVGLWLFDETDYPYTTLTDAGPYEYDLRLMKGGQLVPGRYGNCLKMTPGLDYNTSYAAWKGAVGFYHMREMSGRPGSGLFGPTIAPEKLLAALAGGDFTCEFWLLLMSKPTWDVVLIDLGDRFEPGFKVTLKSNAAGFQIENAYGGFSATCPAVLDQLWGRKWHHVAFTYSAKSKRLSCFIDGTGQPAVQLSAAAKAAVPQSGRPESIVHTTSGVFEKPDDGNRALKPDYDKRIKHRFNFAIGHDRKGAGRFNGNMDELRFSNVIRYRGDFAPPDSHSRNFRKGAPGPAAAEGPPLLFGPGDEYYEPVKLGGRKHVFIDDVIVDRMRNAALAVNPPANPQPMNVKAAWDASFIEHEGKIHTLLSEGYEGDHGPIRLLVSTDGINFEGPDLGLIEFEGTKDNNLVMLGVPSWGVYFKDANPGVLPEERFKATLWLGQRGIYMYFSPDLVHWRRNETCMLPLVSGGGSATFYDDQQGMYFNYIKRDGSYWTGQNPHAGRGTTMFKTREANKAWPFDRPANPYYEGWPFPAVTGEGVTVFDPNIFNPEDGQVFRSRPQKYRWAPDTYVAFLVRNGKADLATSRDAVHWKIRSEQGLGYYWDGMIANGMVRRGDDIWQWAEAGVESDLPDTRLTQRLDGFCSLDAGCETGTVITRPLVFEGSRLVLNAKADGFVRAAIMDQSGTTLCALGTPVVDLPRCKTDIFGIEQCDAIKGDSVRHVVTWNGRSDIGRFAGEVVRVRFEMENAKLFAFQFE
jgi:hypothetical protein